MNDKLGDRMKKYENNYNFVLPPNNYIIIRLDARNFHEYTENMEKPFDNKINYIMDNTSQILLYKIPNTLLVYTQSDEINILLTDNNWYDGNIQKILSVGASIATAYSNRIAEGLYFSDLKTSFNINYFLNRNVIEFDSRVFILPNKKEVLNYFIWRNNDSIRNSISSIVRYLYSHNDIQYKKTDERLQMITDAGKDYENDYSNRNKFGSFFFNNELLKTKNTKQSFNLYENKSIFNLIPNLNI